MKIYLNLLKKKLNKCGLFHNKNITSFHDEKIEYEYYKKILRKNTLFCSDNFKLLLFICSNIICIYLY